MTATIPGGRRRALVIGIPAFAPIDNPSLRDLPFAADLAAQLGAVLEHEHDGYGYLCLTEDADQRLSGEQLGERIHGVLNDKQAEDVLIVHILTHGQPANAGRLYALGADGQPSPGTNVPFWLTVVEDLDPDRRVLFLLDLCHAGIAARLEHQLTTMEGSEKAWVIAASLPGQLAFEGYFTQATANVLDRIRRRLLQIHPAFEHVPFGTLVDWVRAEVDKLSDADDALHQSVTATPIVGSYPDLPFFRNPAYQPGSLAWARRWVDPLTGPFLDELAEFDHFIERAAGYGPLGQADVDGTARIGAFTGRKSVLNALTQWIEGFVPGNVRFVTGCPGAGKSAILGLLVCAAHETLSDITRRLWGPVVDVPIAREPLLVAIHARQRSVAEILTSIGNQLHLAAPAGGWNVLELVQEIRKLEEAPLLVLDALDEAAAPREVVAALLLPLAQETRLDGGPVCRLLLGSRELGEAEPLRRLAEATAGLFDLDRTPAGELRADLRSYVEKLLGDRRPYNDRRHRDSRHAFADALALRLTEDRDRADPVRWGEFLTACLFAHHLINAATRSSTRKRPGSLWNRPGLTCPACSKWISARGGQAAGCAPS